MDNMSGIDFEASRIVGLAVIGVVDYDEGISFVKT